MTEKLSKFISRIQSNEILLPDFQRKFVWTEVDTQQRLIASVLASLPIGSVLLLEGDSGEFVSKQLGRKSKLDISGQVQRNYLLDGQQRLTVLSNVFSNTILKDVKNFKTELAHESLKRRFYLKFSGINSRFVQNDLFGLSSLSFTFDPTDEPNFSSNDIYDLIYSDDLKSMDESPFDPNYDFTQAKATNDLEYVCSIDPDEFIVPLHFLIDNRMHLKVIVKNLADKRSRFLIGYYVSFSSDIKVLETKIKEIFGNDSLPKDYLSNKTSFQQFIHYKANHWEDCFENYLFRTINEIKVHEMEIKKAQRARAIDIYENLNLGGVSLSTFDLIIAKAARTLKIGFYESFKDNLSTGLKIPDFYTGQLPDGELWIPKDRMNIYNESKNSVSSAYINIFLNLLSLVVNVRLNDNPFKMDFIKKSEILKLSSDDIVENYVECINSINKALMFLQMNCGIRKIDDVSYEHILLGIAYYFFDKEVFDSASKTKVLEYWYWTSIFSGTYDTDQNKQIIEDLKTLDQVIYRKDDFEVQKSKLKQRFEDVFNRTYFSDEKTLLMQFSEYGKLPKSVISKTICQFVLKSHPKDFVEETYLNAWDSQEHDVHHIIPLKQMASLKESTSELRANKSHRLNSPLNQIFILSSSNKAIGAQSPDQYFKDFAHYISSSHSLPSVDKFNNDDDIVNWLHLRYEMLKSSLISHLNQLASSSLIK